MPFCITAAGTLDKDPILTISSEQDTLVDRRESLNDPNQYLVEHIRTSHVAFTSINRVFRSLTVIVGPPKRDM